MSADLAPTAVPTPDLPSRTWRGWWLAWPKWFRIGCWAVFILLSLQIIIAIRIAIGWIDDPDISRLRMVGGEVVYPWRDREERFEGEWLLWEGILGRSKRNVYAIVMPKSLDSDTKKKMVARFPNVELVALIPLDAEDALPGSVQDVCKHYAEEARREGAMKPVIISTPWQNINWWPPLERFKTQL